jgi:uncharacterized protein involved in exopolysaccharide biosynthesis
MLEPKSVEINDEIDVRELFRALWRGKYIIFLFSVVAVVLSSINLRNSERKYTVEAVFKPVVEASGSPNLSGLSGLASFAGISLPTSNGSDFTTYQKLIFSEEVAARVFTNQELVVKIFKSEWNSDSGSFVAPERGQISNLKQLVKTVLTGSKKSQYISPNPKRLSMLMTKNLRISVEQKTGFLSISAETSEPDITLEIILSATQETDNLLKERFFSTAEDTLAFYYQKLLTSRSPEHREALAKLISAEDQKLMLASKSSNFVAEPLTTPSVSLYPTSPRPSFVLVIGFAMGLFSGVAIVLTKHLMTKPKAT